MHKTLILVLACTSAAMSVGCAWTVNVANYRNWVVIPAVAFPQYQQAHERHIVPLAALFGLSSVVLALVVAWQGLPHVPRTHLWFCIGVCSVDCDSGVFCSAARAIATCRTYTRIGEPAGERRPHSARRTTNAPMRHCVLDTPASMEQCARTRAHRSSLQSHRHNAVTW